MNNSAINFDRQGNVSMHATKCQKIGTSSIGSALRSHSGKPSLCFRTMGRDDSSRMNMFMKRTDEGLFFNLNYNVEEYSATG